jgi:hypothetical protein
MVSVAGTCWKKAVSLQGAKHKALMKNRKHFHHHHHHHHHHQHHQHQHHQHQHHQHQHHQHQHHQHQHHQHQHHHLHHRRCRSRERPPSTPVQCKIGEKELCSSSHTSPIPVRTNLGLESTCRKQSDTVFILADLVNKWDTVRNEISPSNESWNNGVGHAEDPSHNPHNLCARFISAPQ